MLTQDDFTRINNDTNGNPRYVCHFLRLNIEQDNGQDISEKYTTALSRSGQVLDIMLGKYMGVELFSSPITCANCAKRSTKN